MGKKTTSESSTHSHKKISKNRDKKQQLNSLIKFLKPRVYITDSSNFKNLVQELTGNGSPVSSPQSPIQHTVPVPVPIIDNLEDHAYQENALDLFFDSSEASVPTSFGSALETNYSTGPCIQQPDLNFLESWLLETTTDSCYGHHQYDDVYVPMMVQQEEVSVYDYDISFSYEDNSFNF